MNIFKPEGKVLTFHIGGDSESKVRDVITKKGYIDIQYIKENKDFEDSLK